MAEFTTEGCGLRYEIHGSGEPLVLVPGFASGAWTWKHQVEDLAAQHTVLTFDPRGISASLNSGPPGTIEQIAGDIAYLTEHLKLERVSVLGISFGGFVAQEFALRYPQKMAKLVLGCTSYGGSGHIPPAPEVLMAFASTKGLNSGERIRQYLSMAFTKEFADAAPDVVNDFCDLREQNAVPEEVYTTQLISATQFDVSAQVGGIAAPTLVITGDADTVVPPQNSVNLAKAVRGSELVMIEGGSHMFFVERAAEFNSSVADFLNK